MYTLLIVIYYYYVIIVILQVFTSVLVIIDKYLIKFLTLLKLNIIKMKIFNKIEI